MFHVTLRTETSLTDESSVNVSNIDSCSRERKANHISQSSPATTSRLYIERGRNLLEGWAYTILEAET